MKNKQKSKAEIFLEKLRESFIKNGYEPPKLGNKTGSFVFTMPNKKTTKDFEDKV